MLLMVGRVDRGIKFVEIMGEPLLEQTLRLPLGLQVPTSGPSSVGFRCYIVHADCSSMALMPILLQDP